MDAYAPTQISQVAAALALDPERPPGIDTLRRWHDRIGGPRDLFGRRVWTAEVIEQIRMVRAERWKRALA